MDATNISRVTFLTRNPIACFVFLTFVISYLFGIPFNMLVSPLVKDTNEVIAVLLPRFATVYGPAIAAVIVTRLEGEFLSTKTLLGKLVPKSKYIWWCIGLPFFFVFVSLASFAIAGVPIAQLLEFLTMDWHYLIFQLIAQFFIVGIGEELGWRGWLLPTLTQRRSLITCALWIIVVWGVWHFPIFFGGYQIVLPWLMMLVAMTFLTTWIWTKVDGNIFVLAIVHASFNTSEVFIENRLSHQEESQDQFLSGWTTLGCVYLAIAFVIVLLSYRMWTGSPVKK